MSATPAKKQCKKQTNLSSWARTPCKLTLTNADIMQCFAGGRTGAAYKILLKEANTAAELDRKQLLSRLKSEFPQLAWKRSGRIPYDFYAKDPDSPKGSGRYYQFWVNCATGGFSGRYDECAHIESENLTSVVNHVKLQKQRSVLV